MAKNGKLKAMADAAGIDIPTLVVQHVKKHKNILATSRILGVAPNTIRYWIDQAGFTIVPLPLSIKLQPKSDQQAQG